MYQFKQDLAMAYFPYCSKKTASRLLAREINNSQEQEQSELVHFTKP